MQIFTHLCKLDWKLSIITALLVIAGLASIYSSSLAGGDFFNLQKQTLFFILGILLMLGISFFDWRSIKYDSFFILLLYILCVLLLAGLLFFAPEIRGTRGWYRLGSFLFDPIEPTKIALILLLAKYFSQRHAELYNMRHIFISGIYVAVPSILIFLHPDLGSILILGTIWMGTLLVSGIKVRHFLLLCILFAVMFSFAWLFALQDYQKQRILSFLGPEDDYLGVGWNQAQSKIAIGSGGIFGKGLGSGTQIQYGFLPEARTDFIFAAITEEFGLLGASALFILYFLLVQRTLNIAFSAENNFVRLFSSGFAILLIGQASINIGMNLGLMPVVGIPLPFVSYGGSGLIMNYIGLGILQSIKTH